MNAKATRGANRGVASSMRACVDESPWMVRQMQSMCVYRVTRVHTKRQRAARRTRVKISRKETPGRRVETLYSEKKGRKIKE